MNSKIQSYLLWLFYQKLSYDSCIIHHESISVLTGLTIVFKALCQMYSTYCKTCEKIINKRMILGYFDQSDNFLFYSLIEAFSQYFTLSELTLYNWFLKGTLQQHRVLPHQVTQLSNHKQLIDQIKTLYWTWYDVIKELLVTYFSANCLNMHETQVNFW